MSLRGATAALVLLALLAGVAVLPAQVPAAAALATGLHALATRDATPPPDPFPIRRVLLPGGTPLPTAPEGNPFRRMPREEFEQRVRAAVNVHSPPSLVGAYYRASFAGDSLAGTGEWVVSADGDGALSLDPLKVAVRELKWPDGREALLWGTPAKLWADRRGRTPVAFAWSARGTDEPGAVRFDLSLPAAPLAVLDLNLPADRVPVAKRGQLLTGPFPKADNRAGWKIAFGGESRLEFAVRRTTGAGLPAAFATFARVAKFDLSPGLAVAAFEFDTTAARGPLSTLEFEFDPALTVTDVTAPGLESWHVTDRRLTATFREPVAAGVVAVAAVAAVPTGGEPWPVPTVRPTFGPLTDDRIDVRLGGDVKLDGWSGGDYRLVRTAAADPAFTLSFKGGLPSDGNAPRRPPSLRVRAATAEFATADALEWRVEPGRTQLTARFRVSVSRGPLTRLTFRTPPGFTTLPAVLTPDDPTAAWTNTGGLWTLEPTHPILTGEAVDVRVELRGPAPTFDTPDARPTLAVPVVAPVGTAKRDGTLTIQVSSALRGWLSHAPGDLDARTLKYTHDPVATLTLAAKGVPADRVGEPEAEKPAPAENVWRFADLALAVALDPAGSVRGELSGRVRAAAGRTLSITLPPGAAVESARIDGKWADAIETDGVAHLPIPTPDADGVAFTLAYRLPPTPGWPHRLGQTQLDLPGSPIVRTTWDFGPDDRLWPTLAATADAVPPDAVAVPVVLVRGVGFALAAVLFGFTLTRLLAGTSGRASRSTLLLAAAVFGMAAWLAPDGWRAVVLPPLVVALLGLLALTLVAKPRAVVVVGLTWLLGSTSEAQAPEAATVYFLQESATEPNQLTALVPQTVLDRLTAVATPAVPPLVVTDAEYAGTEADGAARFTATWAVHATRDGPQQLVLPLTSVRLETMTLDGAAAYPDASQLNQYALTVAGRGRHEVKAAFTVAVTGTAGDRDLRFGVPDLLPSRLNFALPPAGRQPSLAGRTGRQTLTRTDAGTTLHADLGRGGAVALRWREGAGANSPPAASVTEATVWDVTDGRAAAHAAFVYQITRGALSRLTFDIPAGLEPGGVTVRGPAAETPNGLRNWELTPAGNGAHRLALELQNPVEGTLAVTFRLFPKELPTLRPALRVPHATNADVTASYLGVRLTGVAVENWQNENLVDFPADAVARDFAAVPEFDFDKTLTRSFRREGTNSPTARPILKPPTLPTPASHELMWSLGTRADVVGVSRWPAGTVTPFVECGVPAGVTLTDVSATDLVGWQRAGNRVRAWFKGDAKDPTLRWTGAWPGYATAAAFELPSVPGTTVRVRPVDDVVLTPNPGRTTKLLPTARNRETIYLADEAAAPPKFTADPPTPTALREAEAVTRTGGLIEQRVTLNLQLTPNRPHSFTLDVSRLPPGTEARVEWPAGVSVAEAGSEPTRRRWQADFAARAEQVVRIVVLNRFPAGPEVTLPAVDLLSAHVPLPKAEHRLATTDDLQPAAGSSCRRVGKGFAWAVTGDDPIRLVGAAKRPASLPVLADDEPTASTESAVRPVKAILFAGAWVLGLFAVAGVARWGTVGWQPEVVTGFGLLAVAVAGWPFAVVAVAGLVMRLVGVSRFVGRRVLR
ncbi:hypothetical protein [Limnoglobus roseus]|uniref:Uncharacterized protein n=1 Tax=Limnoglobus roseus TaxID=2598579 RepID=A0A5C1A3X4_9BACT|nr:hypothetical protein [Limnoglobus roseus]QEL13769.1 hypothetical protein PX52LOC_00627 [Limnoglobus roseus]